MNTTNEMAGACAIAMASVVMWMPAEAQSSRVHKLTVTPATAVWGFFSASKPPILTVASGDTVEIATVLEAAETMQRLGVDEKWITEEMPRNRPGH